MAKRARQVPALAEIFHIMGDPTRLSILMELQGTEKNVTSLVKKLRVPQSTVSHHLALLRMSSLVKARRDGKEIYYSLNGGQIEAAKTLRSVLKGSTGLKIGRLAFGLAD